MSKPRKRPVVETRTDTDTAVYVNGLYAGSVWRFESPRPPPKKVSPPGWRAALTHRLILRGVDERPVVTRVFPTHAAAVRAVVIAAKGAARG